MTIAKDKLVVGKVVTPRSYKIAASTGSTCLAMGVSFWQPLGPRLPSTLREIGRSRVHMARRVTP